MQEERFSFSPPNFNTTGIYWSVVSYRRVTFWNLFHYRQKTASVLKGHQFWNVTHGQWGRTSASSPDARPSSSETESVAFWGFWMGLELPAVADPSNTLFHIWVVISNYFIIISTFCFAVLGESVLGQHILIHEYLPPIGFASHLCMSSDHTPWNLHFCVSG